MKPITTKAVFTAVCAAAALAGGGSAWAQDNQPDRFFSDKVSEAEAEGLEPEDTTFQGSLTSSSLFATESGDEVNSNGQTVEQNASPANRIYTDLRGQFDARHIAGSTFDARLDARARLSSSCTFNSLFSQTLETCRVQSGTYGENEYDLRELYIRRFGSSFDFQIGRQYVLELAATKIDGIRAEYRVSERWGALLFGGLYPARGSRSINEDYPRQVDPTVPNAMPGARNFPVAAGAGGTYRYRTMWGSIGGVGILPRGTDAATNLAEPIRFFVTGNGYWRQSNKLDIYHHVVLDLQGSAGPGVTNLSLGVNYRPSENFRVNAAVNRVDTETLNIIAQNRLDNGGIVNGVGPGSIQNNFEVSRIASQSARLGVSAAFDEQRFEVSVSGQVRQREGVDWVGSNGTPSATQLPQAQAAELMLSVLDRRSYKDFRFGGHFLRVFGFGAQNLNDANANQVRLTASREFKQGLGLYEVEVSYLDADDDLAMPLCDPTNPVDCHGTTRLDSLGLGGTAFYRFRLNWMAVATVNVARQGFTTRRGINDVQQAANLLLTGFLRIAYRF